MNKNKTKKITSFIKDYVNNFFRVRRFPVQNRNVENGVYEPLKHLPKNHWKNKNRHDWTAEEKSKLLIDAFGTDEIDPAPVYVILEEYDPQSDNKFGIIDTDPHKYDKWHVGRIVAMGSQCFDTVKFPEGATATFNDYVNFNPYEAHRTRQYKSNLIRIPDTAITLVFGGSPRDFINNLGERTADES